MSPNKGIGYKKIRILIGLLIITSFPYLYGSPRTQETKPSESASAIPCDGKIDILSKLATVHVNLIGFKYGELPVASEQVRTGKTAIDRDTLRNAVFDSVCKAVQKEGYKLATSDPDWFIAVAYFNHYEKEEEKTEGDKISFTLKHVKRLELTFSTKAKGILCRSVLSPKADVRITLVGNRFTFNAEDIPKEITEIVQGLIPKHLIK